MLFVNHWTIVPITTDHSQHIKSKPFVTYSWRWIHLSQKLFSQRSLQFSQRSLPPTLNNNYMPQSHYHKVPSTRHSQPVVPLTKISLNQTNPLVSDKTKQNHERLLQKRHSSLLWRWFFWLHTLLGSAWFLVSSSSYCLQLQLGFIVASQSYVRQKVWMTSWI